MEPKNRSNIELSSLSFSQTLTNRVNAEAVEAIGSIQHSAILQLQAMAQWATDQDCRDCVHSIATAVEESLSEISELVVSDQIQLFRQIALAEGDGTVMVGPRPLRLGVYPLAANPMHWGHILVGLRAMATMRLDKMVFLIAGTDKRKPSMVPPEDRHRLGRSVIETFYPLFAYTPLALGTDLDGETNFDRLLGLNSHQPMEAYYVAGGDHFRRTTPQGEPDTILKLERVVEEQRSAAVRHSITAVFIDRADAEIKRDMIDTFLKVEILSPIPLSFSSTAARKALCKDAFGVDLVSLPYSCLLEIRTTGLYKGKEECVEEA